MANATDLKRGMIIVQDDQLWKVLSAVHSTPGNKRGLVQASLRNLKSGAKHDIKFRSTEKIESAFIETREFQYLYSDGGLHHFMDTETYEQNALDDELMGPAMQYMIEGATVKMQLHKGTAVGVELPNSVALEVTETGPGTRGDTVSNVFKDATLETGLVVKVPLFVEMGQQVRVDTRTGEFVERV